MRYERTHRLSTFQHVVQHHATAESVPLLGVDVIVWVGLAHLGRRIKLKYLGRNVTRRADKMEVILLPFVLAELPADDRPTEVTDLEIKTLI